MVEEILVERCHLIAGGAVHEYRVEDVHPDNLTLEALHIALAASLEGVAVVGKVDTVAVKHGIVSAGNTHHVELESALVHQALALAANLLYEAAAHGTYTADEEVEHLVFGEEERVVYHVECLAQPRSIYHERDVGLRGTLCTSDDVDTVAAQGTEQLTGDTGGMLHVLAHDSYRGEPLLGSHIVDFARGNLLGKLGIEHRACQLGILIAHTDRGAVL